MNDRSHLSRPLFTSIAHATEAIHLKKLQITYRERTDTFPNQRCKIVRAVQLAVACVAVLVAMIGPAAAGLITINAVNSGHYQLSGHRNGTIENIAASGDGKYRNWLGFDLSSVEGTITSAVLEVGSHELNNSGQLFTWREVTSPYGSLGTIDSLQIYTDLGDGIVFASGTHVAGTINSFAINGAGLASLNSAGSFWAVGGSHSDLNNPWAFGYTFGVASGDDIRLVLQTSASAVPEPSSFALFGIGACAAGIAIARRHRHEKSKLVTT